MRSANVRGSSAPSWAAPDSHTSTPAARCSAEPSSTDAPSNTSAPTRDRDSRAPGSSLSERASRADVCSSTAPDWRASSSRPSTPASASTSTCSWRAAASASMRSRTTASRRRPSSTTGVSRPKSMSAATSSTSAARTSRSRRSALSTVPSRPVFFAWFSNVRSSTALMSSGDSFWTSVMPCAWSSDVLMSTELRK
nr:hypothetical protein [Corallococcus coralloides]